MIDFADYPNVLMKNMNNVIREAHTFLAVFVMHREGHARLDFIQARAARAGGHGMRSH
jgi:hypothetical protein